MVPSWKKLICLDKQKSRFPLLLPAHRASTASSTALVSLKQMNHVK